MELPKRRFKCLACGEEFEEPFGKPKWLLRCPKCQSQEIVRIDEWRGGGGRGFGWCRRGFGPGGGWRGRWGRGRGW